MSPIVAKVLTFFLALLFSLTVHEAAHAWTAKIRGDDTAERMGRLTLNPIPHMDFFGTLIIPLLGIVTILTQGIALPLFGYAKPVPVDLSNLKDPKWDHFWVAAAGPISNLILCGVCLVAVVVQQTYFRSLLPEGGFFYPLLDLLKAMIGVNALLAFFNLIPIPPLDGATVFSTFLPDDWAEKYESIIAPYGMIILMVLFISGALGVIRVLSDAYVQTLLGVIVAVVA